MFDDLLNSGKKYALRMAGRILDEHVPRETREALTRGEFWVPEPLLAAGLAQALGEDTPLRNLKCSPAGVGLVMGVSRLGATLDVKATLAVEELLVRSDRQEVTVTVRDLDVAGANWVGRLTAPLAATILRRVYGDKLVELAGSADLEVRRHPDAPDRFTADLGGLPQVQRLKSVSLGKWTLLDLVQVTGCRHSEGGLYLKGEVSLPSLKT